MMSASDFRRFVDALFESFDRVIGPTIESGAIRLRELSTIDDLPTGVIDEQEAGTYRVRHSGTPLHFSYGVGADSLKSIVHPSRAPVWTMRRSDGTLLVDPALTPRRTTAVLGAKACDLRALGVLERTQTGGPHADPGFLARRDGLFLVGTDCTHPATTCFCGTLGGGPVADRGFDVALTEVIDSESDTAEYVVRSGTAAGRALLDRLDLVPAASELVARAEAELRRADRALLRELPATAADVVGDAAHPHWEVVAERCLTCGNCTAVCPTCFCTDMEDRVELDGRTATRTRVWDTCFSQEYSHLGAGPHRSTTMSRYRQWLSHKLGTWHDQYGESGCVGCGRCITWCPVGIDITAEVESLTTPAATP
jgi:ferredoxin